MIQYASTHRDATAGLALLAIGAQEVVDGAKPDTAKTLESAQRLEPRLADYAGYLIAKAAFQTGDFAASAKAAEFVVSFGLPSPVAGSAAMVGAKSYLALGNPSAGVALLRRSADRLLQPAGDALLASAYEASGDLLEGAKAYRRIWLGYPASPEAQDAEAALARLEPQLGTTLGSVTPSALLGRAGKLVEAREFERARRAYEAIVSLPAVSALDLDLARVRLGVVDYRAGHNVPALRYLAGLNVQNTEADAERLYYVLACARRLNDLGQMTAALAELGRKHTRSEWRLEALVAAGNEYLVLGQPDDYDLPFRQCFEEFPTSPQAPYCHWRVAFSGYIRNLPAAEALLRDQLVRYPRSDFSSPALYFLGRLAERSSDWAAAKAYYARIESLFPNYYYAVQARSRQSEPPIAGAPMSKNATEFLGTIHFPSRGLRGVFEPKHDAVRRFERARLLNFAALDDFADLELKYGARTEGQPEAYGLELARGASRRLDIAQSIRYLKRFASGYLYSPVDAAPFEFWQLSFPLPWRGSVEKYSNVNGLDPFVLAALIRQESEFDPRAVSRANARGLTQVLPSTGRELSRRLRVRGYRTNMLFNPDFNLRLGTLYLKSLLTRYGGEWEPALAAYNAGGSRVALWLSRSNYREPAEFVESIPFTETRNYVQIVLRNADLYRRLYSLHKGQAYLPKLGDLESVQPDSAKTIGLQPRDLFRNSVKNQ